MMDDPLDDLFESVPRVYSRRIQAPQPITANGIRKHVAQPADDWETLKISTLNKDDDDDFSSLKLNYFSKQTSLRRTKSEGGNASSPVKNGFKADIFAFDEFDSLAISKSSDNPPPTGRSLLPSTTTGKTFSVNSYAFDEEWSLDSCVTTLKTSGGREGDPRSGSCSQSSQESTNSTGSSYSLPSKAKDDSLFRRPVRPLPRKEEPPSVSKCESFPPSRKRLALQGSSSSEPVKKQASPDKPRHNDVDRFAGDSLDSKVVPSTSRAKNVSTFSAPVTDPPLSDDTDVVETLEGGKIKCSRNHKDLFVVVQHVRRASECRINGEIDDLKNEIEFLLENLSVQGNNLMTRCLSAINLSSKLLDPSFRVHFFAHAPTGIFDVMKDAASDANLSLCTAAVILVLSTDNLKMDLNAAGLQLLADILNRGRGDAKHLDKRVVDGVRNVIAQSRYRDELSKDTVSIRSFLCGLQNIVLPCLLNTVLLCRHRDMCLMGTVGPPKSDGEISPLEFMKAWRLTLEGLMSMKLGSQIPWFVGEIRDRGILGHFVEHICALLPVVEARPTPANISAVFRVTEFFYKVMHNDRENSVHWISFHASGYKSVVRVISFCTSRLLSKNISMDLKLLVASLLRSSLAVLLCVSGHAELWRGTIGSQLGLMELLAKCCFNLSVVLPADKYQDILVQALLCLVNLTLNCESNSNLFMKVEQVGIPDGRPPLMAFVKLMKETSDAAASSGDALDDNLDQYEKRRLDPDANVTLTDILEKAGENMEHFSIMCYIGILMSHLLSHSEVARVALPSYMDEIFGSVSNGVEIAVGAIRRVMEFITDADAQERHPLQNMHTVVDILEAYEFKCKQRS